MLLQTTIAQSIRRFGLPILTAALLLTASSLLHAEEPAEEVAEPTYADATEIVLEWGPPSVAPEYRRTRTWTVTPTALHFTVTDGRGDEVKVAVTPITEEHWANVLATIDTAELHIGEQEEDAGCTGGTTRHLRISEGETVLLDGRTYVCASTSSGPLHGDHAALLEAIQADIDPEMFEHD